MYDYDEQDFELDPDLDVEEHPEPIIDDLEDLEESAIEVTDADFTIPKKAVTELKDRMKEILSICQIYRVPCYMTFVTEDNGSGTKYVNVLYGTKSNGIHLRDDQIERHVLIANGFSAVPGREVLELDMDKQGEFPSILEEEEQE